MSASEQPASGKVLLSVTTGDEQADIFVLDAHSIVQRGVARLEARLDPGIYRVKVRTGSETREEHVVLWPNATEAVQKHFAAGAFPSPIPLNGTTKTHEYHMGAAERTSRRVHVPAGEGAKIFVFARDWTPPGHEADRVAESPTEGLKLVRDTGELVADLGAQGERDTSLDAWAGCTVAVDPGNYTLRLDLTSGESLSQTIVATQGWQTQVFLLLRNYGQPSGVPPVRRVDLASGSIVLTGVDSGFNPGHPWLRRSELARLSLAHRGPSGDSGGDGTGAPRRLLSGEVLNLLEHKLENPMLGIYGGHLLLLEDVPDVALLGKVVTNLRKLVGHAHPDVEALALAAGAESPQRAANVFAVPPMLRRSWLLVIDATMRQPDLVSAGSLAARVSRRLWHEGAWHVWVEQSRARDVTETPAEDELEECLVERLERHMKRRPRRASLKETGPGLLSEAVAPPRAASAIQNVPQEEISEREMHSLARTFGVPRSELETLLASAAGRFTRRRDSQA